MKNILSVTLFAAIRALIRKLLSRKKRGADV